MAQTNKLDLSSQAKFKIAGINPQTGTSYTVLAADMGKLVTLSNVASIAVTLPQSGSAGFPALFWFWIENIGTGAVTITPTTSTIDGQATLALAQYQGATVFGDGVNWFTIRGAASSGSGSGLNGVNAQTVDYTALSGDNGKLLTFNGTNKTLTLPATPPSSTWAIFVQNRNASDLTISRNGLNIDGAAANVVLHQNQGAVVFTDGTNYFTERGKPTVIESDIILSDITTDNVSTSMHGFAPKAPNDATKFLDGTGNYSPISAASVTGGFAWGGDASDGAATFDGTTTIDGVAPIGASLTLTSVAAGTGVYTGTITGGNSNTLSGITFVITGFVNAANNGTFLCTASSLTTITLVNTSSVSETHAATATSGGLYILTRDIFHASIVVNSSVTIKTANYRIFCAGTLTVNGTIQNNGLQAGKGGNGSGGIGGAAGTAGAWTSSTNNVSGSMNISIAVSFSNGNPSAGNGGNGGTAAGSAPSTAGGAGINVTDSVAPGGTTGASGAAGGAGGAGASGAGGAAGAAGLGKTVTAATSSGRAPAAMLPGWLNESSTSKRFSMLNGPVGGASGGGGGGGDTTNSGGGGGGAGGSGGYAGYTFIAAKSIVVGASGIISANGGNGGDGGNGQSPALGNTGGGGAGAGGSGGSGGILWLIYQSLTNSGTISANGGNGGNAGSVGTGHGTGTNGSAAAAGVTGPAGIIIQIAC